MPSTDSATATRFPTSVDELTPDWIGEVLGLRVTGLTGHDISLGKGMMGEVWKLDLAMANADPVSVVAKFAARGKGTLTVERKSEIFAREINFYRNVSPLLGCRTARQFGSWFNSSTAEFLILMEFIDADGSANQFDGISFDRSCLVMNQLAALHATNTDGLSTPMGFSQLCSETRREHQKKFVRAGWTELQSHLTAPAASGLCADRVAESVDAAYRRLAVEPTVLCHADPRPDNLLFAKSGDSVTLIDWQGISLGPAAWDVGYYIAQGVRSHDRRSWGNRLIAVYLDALQDKIPVDRGTFTDLVNLMAWYSLAIACSLFSLGDRSAPETIRLAATMGDRAIDSLVDSGQI